MNYKGIEYFDETFNHTHVEKMMRTIFHDFSLKPSKIESARTWNNFFMNHDDMHKLAFKGAYVPDGLKVITNDLISLIEEIIVESYKKNVTFLIPVYENVATNMIQSSTDSFAAANLYVMDMISFDYCLAVDFSKEKYIKVIDAILTNLVSLCLTYRIRNKIFDISESTFTRDIQLLLHNGYMQEKVILPFDKMSDLEIDDIYKEYDKKY